MKSTGISRPVDALGRVVIPMEIREAFGIKTKDCLEIFVQGDKIILRKRDASCLFCENTNDLVNYQDKKICKECLAKLANLADN